MYGYTQDHVWVEVELPGRGWVHMDPCEAAVDEPLLYQSWGKNQTYILAFTRDEVADVTHIYTSDFEAARMRRKVPPEEFANLLDNATGLLKQRPEEPGSARAIASSTTGVIRKKRGGGSGRGTTTPPSPPTRPAEGKGGGEGGQGGSSSSSSNSNSGNRNRRGADASPSPT